MVSRLIHAVSDSMQLDYKFPTVSIPKSRCALGLLGSLKLDQCEMLFWGSLVKISILRNNNSHIRELAQTSGAGFRFVYIMADDACVNSSMNRIMAK